MTRISSLAVVIFMAAVASLAQETLARSRMYHAGTGRFAQRDPLGYADGMNQYEYVRSDPVSLQDSLGLTGRPAIPGRLLYTRKCGWIDFGRSMGAAKQIWNTMKNESGVKSLRGGGYRVRASYRHGPRRLYLGTDSEFYVPFGLDEVTKKSVALGIFNESSVVFEWYQRNWCWRQLADSGHSEEDLPSNLTSFYRVVRGYSRGEIEDMCEALNAKDSRAIWDEVGGLKQKVKKWNANKNHWPPAYATGSQTAVKCCGSSTKWEWPEKLREISAEPKGEKWRDWERRLNSPESEIPDEIIPDPNISR